MAMQGAVPELLLMDGAALTRALQAGRVSCVELMNDCLDHIARLNPAFNAIVALQERDVLLSQARDCDAERRRGQVRGPLHGVPFAVKDLEPVRGIRTTYGSPL